MCVVADARRILVTGSRDWCDIDFLQRVLERAFVLAPAAVLVHGGCRGVDVTAASVWIGLGGVCEVHPADWDAFGRSAGPRRNQEMVDSGVDVCLAFVLDDSRGASHCASVAVSAGVCTFQFDKRSV